MNEWIFLEKSLFFSVPYPVPISVLQTRKNRNFVQYLGIMIKYDTDSGDAAGLFIIKKISMDNICGTFVCWNIFHQIFKRG